MRIVKTGNGIHGPAVAVRITHLPTGIVVKANAARNIYQCRKLAKEKA